MEVEEPTSHAPGELAEAVLRWWPRMEPPEVLPLFLDDGFALDRRVVVAHEEGELRGVALRARLAFHPPERVTALVVVDPEHRGRGVGTALHDVLVADLDPAVRALRASTHDDDDRSGAVAEHWGYAALQRSITARRDVTDAEPPEVPPGVTVESYPDLALPDPGAVERMLVASQTNPEVAHSGAMSLEMLLGTVASDEVPLLVVARVDGTPAAISFGMAKPPVAYVSYTGVDPAYRGRGLARLAKQALHVAARAAGVDTCYTDNEEHNTGIRRVNAELGYEVVVGVWRRERRLVPRPT